MNANPVIAIYHYEVKYMPYYIVLIFPYWVLWGYLIKEMGLWQFDKKTQRF